jgi:hypothetical protein
VPNLVLKLQPSTFIRDRPYDTIRIRTTVIIDTSRALLLLQFDAALSMEKDYGHAFEA